jgi:acetoin utilization protein AcuB
MLVRDRMVRNPVTVGPKDSLFHAQRKMKEGGFRQLPVLEDGRLVGIVTDRDIRLHERHLRITTVSAAMTQGVITVSPTASIQDATRLLLQNKIGGLPVLEGEKLVGIITITDVLRAFLELSAERAGEAPPGGGRPRRLDARSP